MHIIVGLAVVLVAVASDEVHPEGIFADIPYEVVAKGTVNAHEDIVAAPTQHGVGALSPDEDVVFIATGKDIVAVVPQGEDGDIQVGCGKNIYACAPDVLYPANGGQRKAGADDRGVVQAWDFFNGQVGPVDFEVDHGCRRGGGNSQESVG